MTPSPRIIPGEVVRRTLTRLNLSGIIHYSLIMIFAAFFVFSPPLPLSLFLSIVCTTAGPRGEGTSRERNLGGRALTTYRSRSSPHSFSFFDRAVCCLPSPIPSSLSLSCRSIFSHFTLNHKYKSREHRESIEITGRTPLFCFRVVEARWWCVHVYFYFHTRTCARARVT